MYHQVGANGKSSCVAYEGSRYQSPCPCIKFKTLPDETVNDEDIREDLMIVVTTVEKLKTFENAVHAAANAKYKANRAYDAYEIAKEELGRSRAEEIAAAEVCAAAAKALREDETKR